MNKKLFEVKYFGATNNRGSRIKIIDSCNGNSVIISYDYRYNNALDGAIAFLVEKKGIKKDDISYGELKNSYIIILNDFTIKL